MIYSIYYPKRDVVQRKLLISHESYLKYVAMPQDSNTSIKKAKAYLSSLTGGKEFFTDGSPLFHAIGTGKLKCNGEHHCIITKIE